MTNYILYQFYFLGFNYCLLLFFFKIIITIIVFVFTIIGIIAIFYFVSIIRVFLSQTPGWFSSPQEDDEQVAPQRLVARGT